MIALILHSSLVVVDAILCRHIRHPRLRVVHDPIHDMQLNSSMRNSDNTSATTHCLPDVRIVHNDDKADGTALDKVEVIEQSHVSTSVLPSASCRDTHDNAGSSHDE